MNNINNNFNSQNNGQISNNKGQKLLSGDERLNIIVEDVQKILAERSEREVPENGKFLRVGMFFPIPDTSNEAVLSIVHDELEPKDKRRFEVGVRHKYSDKITSQDIISGTKKEIIEYLKNSNNKDVLKKTVLELSKYVDDNH